MRVVEHRAPRWADDGSAIFFGIREWPTKPATRRRTGRKRIDGSPDRRRRARRRSTGGEAEEESGGDGEGEAIRAGEKSPSPPTSTSGTLSMSASSPCRGSRKQRDRAKSYLVGLARRRGALRPLGSDYRRVDHSARGAEVRHRNRPQAIPVRRHVRSPLVRRRSDRCRHRRAHPMSSIGFATSPAAAPPASYLAVLQGRPALQLRHRQPARTPT